MAVISPRPTLLVDGVDAPGGVVDNAANQLGTAGPLSRRRVLPVLPFKDGPRLLRPALLVAGIADAVGNRLGSANQVYCHRILVATKTEDTRRL